MSEIQRQDACVIQGTRVKAGEYVFYGPLGLKPVHSLPAEFPQRVQKFRFLAMTTQVETASNHIEAAVDVKGLLMPKKI